MKLSIAKKESTTDKSDETTNKFFKTMGLNQSADTDTSKPKTFTFNKGNKKTLSDIKGKKSIMAKSNELTLDKFDKVEQLTKKILNLDNSFNEFLSSQNDSIKTIASFNDKIDNLEVLILNAIKNQSSILNAVNSFHSKAFQKVDTDTNKTVDTDTNKTTVITRKKVDNNQDEANDYYDVFQSFFNGNFLGESNLTPEIKPIWIELLQAIDDNSPDTIESSIKSFRSQFNKSGQIVNDKKRLTAVKSNAKFIQSIIKAIAKMQGKTFDLKDTTQNSEVFNKEYFTNTLELTIDNIDAIISDLQSYGKMDTVFINAVSDHLPNVSDNNIGQFVKWLKAYVS